MNPTVIKRLVCLLFCLVQLLPNPKALAVENTTSEVSMEGEKGKNLFASLSGNPDYVAVDPGPLVAVDLRYATENNFAGVNLYGNFNRCYLHRTAAQKLDAATEELSKIKPGWKLLVFDCLRPRQIQELLYQKVKGTPQQSYVADPKKGSIHNYGFAVDLSLVDENGIEVDMGTPFDAFDAISRPSMEAQFLKEGKLTGRQVENRLILRSVMEKSGFFQLPIEWWHFDAMPSKEVRKHFKIIE